jgi:N-acetyltransferase
VSFDRQPTLIGTTLLLRPLLASDFESMYSAAADPLIWEQQRSSFNRHLREPFRDYFEQRLQSNGTLTVIDRVSGAYLGWSSDGVYDDELDEIEVGWTFLIRSAWGGAVNRELKSLMLGHAFQSVPTVVFRIAATNQRSRLATAKLGAKLTDRTGTFSIPGGPVLESVVYAMSASDFADRLPDDRLPDSQ